MKQPQTNFQINISVPANTEAEALAMQELLQSAINLLSREQAIAALVKISGLASNNAAKMMLSIEGKKHLGKEFVNK